MYDHIRPRLYNVTYMVRQNAYDLNTDMVWNSYEQDVETVQTKSMLEYNTTVHAINVKHLPLLV